MNGFVKKTTIAKKPSSQMIATSKQEIPDDSGKYPIDVLIEKYIEDMLQLQKRVDGIKDLLILKIKRFGLGRNPEYDEYHDGLCEELEELSQMDNLDEELIDDLEEDNAEVGTHLTELEKGKKKVQITLPNEKKANGNTPFDNTK